MFTGIVEEVGKIKTIRSVSDGLSLLIGTQKVLEDIKEGDSIAVNGVCLTCTKRESMGFWADVSKETLQKSNLSNVSVGDYLNLERALRLSDRLSGHIVLGHIDDTAKLVAIKNVGDFYVLRIELTPYIKRYVVYKGSVCVDGISLTVANLSESFFEVAVIPHTFNNTALKFRPVSYKLNIEVDYFAKYIERFINQRSKR